MDTNFNLRDLLTPAITGEFKDAIDEIISTSPTMTNGQLILQLCDIIMQKIDIIEKTKYIAPIGRTVNIYSKGNQNLAQEEETQLMVFGARLIYTLRTFLLEEEITYHLATKNKEGGYEASAFIPQAEILKSFSKVSRYSIGVTQSLQQNLINAHKKDNIIQTKRKNMWSRIEYLSEANVRTGRNIGKIDLRKPNSKEAHWAYQNQKKDFYIYIKYYGGSQRKFEKYYDMDGLGKRESLIHFNNGWLWQWYNEVLYSGTDGDYLMVEESLNKGILKPIIKGKDWVSGTKQGDFRTANNNWVQSKYGNTKIITYNNIRHVIFDLRSALSEYLAESTGTSEKLINVLQEHFLPESVDIGNNIANKAIDELLSKINKKI